MRPILAMFFCVSPSFLFGCSLINTFDLREDTIETCTNGKDDDGDGLKNCFDPECVALVRDLVEKEGWSVQEVKDRGLESCLEATDEYCHDEIDNDMDGFIDCRDSDCTELDSCQEDTDEHCADGLDNDMNGFTDCLDEKCKELEVCRLSREVDPQECRDLQDTDGDTIGDTVIGCPCLVGPGTDDDVGVSCPCHDGKDNDGDDLIDCDDPDCHDAAGDGCNPAQYNAGDPVLEDDFSGPFQEGDRWGIYYFESAEERQWDVSSSGGELHIMVYTDTTPAFSFREEKGIYSKQLFNLWDNVTDVDVDLKVTDNDAHTLAPAVVGFAIDSTEGSPFLDKSLGEGEGLMGRKAVLVLLVDAMNRVRLCWRKVDDEPLQCYPGAGPFEPPDRPPAGETANYRISIDDLRVTVYQNFRKVLRIPNPYDPGIARLFLVASTDKPGAQSKSEMFIDGIRVYQVVKNQEYPDVFRLSDTPSPQLSQTCDFEPDCNCCDLDPAGGVLSATWNCSPNQTCSTFVGSNVAERRFQMAYDFYLVPQPNSIFLPGMWEPMMNFDLGMAFAAGVQTLAELETSIVFRSCNVQVRVAPYESPPAEVKLSVIAGHDPDKYFSYALFQETDDKADFFSVVQYETACFILTQFGLTSKNAPRQFSGTVFGIVEDVSITGFAQLGETQYDH